MNNIIAIAAASLISSIAPKASAQSYNIDFGNLGSPPPANYAAAGLAGTWTAIGVPAPGTFYALLNLQGRDMGITLNNIGGTQLLFSNDPATSGADQSLMDDMLIGFNNPVDVCIWINDVPNGEYEVLIYAMTPSNPSLLSRTRVDFADQGPVWIGGAWPGAHQQGVTYSRHTVNVTTNEIGLHSGLWQGNVQSGINGIQVRPLIPGDATGDALIDVNDLITVINAWGQCPSSTTCPPDFNEDGIVDVDDLLMVIGAWS